MPSNLDSEPYAIFRTRFQPFNSAHKWAIENFFAFAEQDKKRTMGATKLWLTIVDPRFQLIPLEYQNKFPRASEDFNPLTEMQVMELAHQIFCINGIFSCKNISRLAVPSFYSVRVGEDKKIPNPFNLLINKLPRNKIWYFPIFDWDDLEDITLIWKHLNKQKIIISYNPSFSYKLNIPIPGINTKDMGIYAASFVSMLGYKVENDNHEAVPLPEITIDYLQRLKSQDLELKKKLDNLKDNMDQGDFNPFTTSNNAGFNFVKSEEIVNYLLDSYEKVIKPKSMDEFFDDVKFLGTCIKSEQITKSLLNILPLASIYSKSPNISGKIKPYIRELQSNISPSLSRLTVISKNLKDILSKSRLKIINVDIINDIDNLIQKTMNTTT